MPSEARPFFALALLCLALHPSLALAQDPPPEEPPPPPLEISVEGEKAPPGTRAIPRREIRDMPGVLGDPFRAVELQPGVTPTASGIPYSFIRGAPPGNVGFFIDDIRIPLLFHVGAGPGTLPASLIRDLHVHLGPYPANIGRLAGAAVEAQTTPPPMEWRGEAAFRFTDIGGLVQGPASDKTDVLVGGRYAIGAPIINALVPGIGLGYADYQARVSHKLNERERLTLFAFGAYDYLAAITDESGSQTTDVLLDTDFHRLDLRYDRQDPSGQKIRAAVLFGLDQSRGVGADSAQDFKIGARLRYSRPIASGKALFRAGLDTMLDAYRFTPRTPAAHDNATLNELDQSFDELFPSRTDLVFGAYADALIALGDSATITPGLRVDHYSSLGNTALAVDPKIVGRFGVGKRLHLVPAFGVASQLPGFAPLPALQIAGILGGLQRSLQSSFGAELSLGPVELLSTVFRNVTFDLTDPIGTGRGTSFGKDRFLNRSLGDAYGFELAARGALRRDLFFFASYTLSRATRTRDGLTLPSAYDRAHILHVALLYNLGNNWRAGIRHVLYSGFPADEASEGHAPDPHPDRTRPFYRVDLRLSKRWKIGSRGYLGLVFDMQNATLSKEVFDVTCKEDRCTPRTLGPITIPTLALEGGF